MFNSKINIAYALLLMASLPLMGGWEESAHEQEAAWSLIPDISHGGEVYEACAVCHMPEGWGTPNGAYPQIAGQHRSVIIKQLADIRAKNRDNPSMYPFAVPEEIGGVQSIADLAAYIEQLKMTSATGKGDGTDLAYGASLYRNNCVDCHGELGEGNGEKTYPRLQGQHYHYLLRQLTWIQSGKRRNANQEMMRQIRHLTLREFKALSDYVSRMAPDADKLSPYTWRDRR